MKVPGARFLRWNMPDHLRRTSMSSRSRSSHLVSPFLGAAGHVLLKQVPIMHYSFSGADKSGATR